MKKLLIDYQKNKLIEIDFSTGIKLNPKILENIEIYDQAHIFINNSYKKLKKGLIELIFQRLYDRKEPTILFEIIAQDYEYYQFQFKTTPEVIKPTPTISSGKKKPKKKGKSNDLSEVSLGHSKLNLSAIYRYLEEKKWKYCIWISKLPRDHNKSCMGQLDPGGIVFQKLIDSLGLTFSNQNGWEQIIYKSVGLYFSWAVNKNGLLRFWINDYLSWELFFEHLQKKLEICDFTSEEFKEFISVLEDSEKKKLFYLETANLIGPRDIIERDFNKACLIYPKVYFKGLYKPVKIEIDKSKGPYEIEFKGAYGPTRRVQEITTNPVAFVESIGVLDYKFDTTIDIGIANSEAIVNVGNGLQAIQIQVPKVEARVFNLDKKVVKSIQNQKDIKKKIDLIKNILPKLQNELILANNKGALERVEIRHSLVQLIYQLLRLDTNFHEDNRATKVLIEKAFFDTSNEINSAKEEIIEKLETIDNSIQEKFKDLQKYIESEFQNLHSRVKSNLYLTIRKMDHLPEITAKNLAAEMNVSRKTVYSYLKKLQDKKLITSEVKKNPGPGRPGRIFKLNLSKLYKIIKK